MFWNFSIYAIAYESASLCFRECGNNCCLHVLKCELCVREDVKKNVCWSGERGEVASRKSGLISNVQEDATLAIMAGIDGIVVSLYYMNQGTGVNG